MNLQDRIVKEILNFMRNTQRHASSEDSLIRYTLKRDFADIVYGRNVIGKQVAQRLLWLTRKGIIRKEYLHNEDIYILTDEYLHGEFADE